jgi:hypothetical protein
MTQAVEDQQVAEQRSVRPDLDELRTSARGWHGVQLAVLGFIGLCGALQAGSDGSGPGWLQRLAAVLVLAALALACVATALVAGQAWPVSAGRRHPAVDGVAGTDVRRGGRRLRTGIALTFLAVALVALATSSSWWPQNSAADSSLVEVSTGQGVFCGSLVSADAGALGLQIAGRQIQLPLGQVTGVRPVSSCTAG